MRYIGKLDHVDDDQGQFTGWVGTIDNFERGFIGRRNVGQISIESVPIGFADCNMIRSNL